MEEDISVSAPLPGEETVGKQVLPEIAEMDEREKEMASTEMDTPTVQVEAGSVSLEEAVSSLPGNAPLRSIPPQEPPRVEADPAAMAESLDTALEPEVLPPGGKKPRKRRAVGLPRLQIDARDNTVEISAFNLQIKL